MSSLSRFSFCAVHEHLPAREGGVELLPDADALARFLGRHEAALDAWRIYAASDLTAAERRAETAEAGVPNV